ncbi:MAG: helicase-exonuclease AddAB subunit AddA [Defluviitaleaceae bacterium]|nr:helicase-exonuclease AddAB subunit AddA [Defluviitaleaceae bacterium]
MTNFTPAQNEAINCNAQEILVSAAAGSGKTAVLTERIVRHISEGVELDRLLVVTFTEAASAEMRERIEKKLNDKEELSHHALLLPLADISTIHAFCRKLIRENFHAVDIDPAFKIADDAELSLIRTQVMDELFEAEYQRENADFIDLVDVYGGKTTDGRLETLVLGLFNFMESDPFPKEAAKRYAASFSQLKSLDETPWAKIAREEIKYGMEAAIEAIEKAIKLCNLPGGPLKYVDKLRQEAEMLCDFGAGDFEGMYEAFRGITWGRLPTITAKDEVDPSLKERVQRLRNKAVKERIKGLEKGVFFATPQKMLSDLQALAPRVHALLDLTVKFSDAYSAEKKARNIMDFSDLEHYAIRILYPDGPSDMTPADVQKYHEVLIDEYQDSNEIQDLILTAVAERRFLVGDVKQSIYRFRRANPELFLQKYEGDCVRIDLSHNFRSRPKILDAVNFLFSKLMTRQLGDVEYDDAAALRAGRDEQKGCPQKMWLELLDQNEENDEGDEESVSNIIAETRVLAKCIKEIVTDYGYDFGDIAIIARSFSMIAGEVVEELKSHGIPAIADINEGFFEQQEIKTAIAFLRVIDNPRQDIELITVLTSPVYALNADDLYEISQHEGVDFYEKLISSQKAQNFLDDLAKWRDAAVYLPINRLIGLVYDTTYYPSHVLNMVGGELRQANLRILLEKAMEFEQTSLKGLFHFIRYIERLSAVGNVASAVEPTVTNKVRLMTIHKSKGLEFPVVICAFLAKKFNTDDERRPVILHSAHGVGAYYVDTALRTRANTLSRYSLARLTRRENLSEELRCLYVAMTRAQEVLILSGRAKNLQAEKEKWTDNINAASYLDWIMPCIIGNPEEAERIFKIREYKPEKGTAAADLPPTEKPKMFWSEPLEASSSLPSKLTISEIKRLHEATPTPSFDPPTFMKEESGITPASLGSALHVITEHIDFHVHTTPTAVADLIQSLIDKNLLAQEESAAIPTEKVVHLANSPLGDRLRKAATEGKLHRETPFVIALPAVQLYTEATTDDTILVHGIIDCHFEESGKIILVDYKSDYISGSLENWAKNHRVQLDIYKQALSASTGMEVGETLLYSFYHGKTVNM